MIPTGATESSLYCFKAWMRLALAVTPVCAQDAAETLVGGAADQPPETAISGDDSLCPVWGGFRTRLSDHGFDYSVTYIGEVLGNVAGGIERGVIYEGLLKAQVDFDTAKLGAWPSGAFHGSALYPHGEGLSEKYLGDLFTLSNIDAPDAVCLFELWYEHQFGALSLRVGQLAADEEFAFTDYGAVFINGTVGWPAIIALNAPTPAYPLATPGVRLAANLGGGWSLQTAVYNGDPCPEDSNGNELNPHGVYWSFQDAFVIAELKREWHREADAAGLPGQAKLGGWYHTGQFDHQRLDDTGLPLSDPASTGQPLQVQGNWGLYLTVEQQLWREPAADPASDQGVGVFARFGGSPGDRNPLEYYAEGGVTCTGLLPGREADVCGVAVVYGQMSHDARQLAEECNCTSAYAGPLPDYEMVVEATYRVAVRPGFTTQPVAAYVIHPGGSAGGDALVLGLRFNLDF